MKNMHLRQATANLLRRFRNFPSRAISSSGGTTINSLPLLISRKTKFSHQYGSGGYTWRKNQSDSRLWILLFGQAGALTFGVNPNLVLAEDVSIQSDSQNDAEGASVIGLRKIEDGSVVSNVHTSKWRIFTDCGRDYFMQGKLEEAEKFFLSALQEAKEGFGERDPHIASACNNLAELYRVKKEFDKAEPLYMEAINILQESFGPEDIRVGVALHNLGQLYLVRRKLEDACICYERALKIKGRVLGHGSIDYADTMYHLGVVLCLLGKEKEAEALFQESVRILEENGQGESTTCIRRLRYLVQVYIKVNRLAEVENVQRKILHILEISKGWNSLDTVIAAEELALTLQATGNLKEAQELFERCLDAREKILPQNHIQAERQRSKAPYEPQILMLQGERDAGEEIGANMRHIAGVAMLKSNRLKKINVSAAIVELDKAKEFLDNARRIARHALKESIKQNGEKQNYGASAETYTKGCTALVILLQSLEDLALVETTKQELQDLGEEYLASNGAEAALFECISAYKEFETEKLISDSPKVKSGYLSCLNHLLLLMIGYDSSDKTKQSKEETLQWLKDEIKRIEDEIYSSKRRKR